MTTDAHALAGTPAGLFRLSSLDLLASDGFAAWLAGERATIVCTTGGQILLVGVDEQGELEVRSTAVPAPAGIAVAGPDTFHVACDWQLWRYVDARAVEPATDDRPRSRHFLAQSAWTTGFVGAYDLAIGRDGQPLFASSITNCVATVSNRLNFTAVWKPPFVSAIGAGDRCHLTGLATEDGDLRFVTVAAASDTVGGWRGGLRDGAVVDAVSGEAVAAGLCLPHSPRIADDGTLLVAAAGTGELLAVDRADGSTRTVARPGGFARGLAVRGRYAVVGASKLKADSPYGAAPIATEAMRQAIVVVDLESGTVVADLELRGSTGEIVALDLLTDTHDAVIGPVAADRDSVVAIATD